MQSVALAPFAVLVVFIVHRLLFRSSSEFLLALRWNVTSLSLLAAQYFYPAVVYPISMLLLSVILVVELLSHRQRITNGRDNSPILHATSLMLGIAHALFHDQVSLLPPMAAPPHSGSCVRACTPAVHGRRADPLQ
jgi:hypothetical protein